MNYIKKVTNLHYKTFSSGGDLNKKSKGGGDS